MSSAVQPPTGPHESTPMSAGSTLSERIHQGELLFGALVLLSAIGIGVTNFAPERGFQYWAAMVPLFGGVAVFLAWSHARARGDATGAPIRAQIFHWLGVFGAIWLVFLLKTAGQLEYDVLGLVSLLVLALGTFLAGVYADWRLSAVGVLLGAIAAAGAFVQQMIWLAVVPAIILIAVIALAWRRRGQSPVSASEGF